MKIVVNFLLIASSIFIYHSSFACTTILIGKKASKDGSVIMAHNEDMGRETAGVLKYYTGRNFSSHALINVPYVELEQVSKTFSFWGAGNARNVSGLGVLDDLPYEYNNILVGMNENGVAISCNWMNSKDENLKKKGIRRFAIRQLVLERAKTSREAVSIITEFIDKFGQADWGGLTYNVADSKEAWVIETTSHQWVARRIRDNEIWIVANRFTITDDYDLESEHLLDYAIDNNWISETVDKINFREVFGKFVENNQAYDIGRENLVEKELANYKGEIDMEVLMKILQHRYQDVENFKPISEECWRDYCEKNNIKRPLSSCLTQSSFIAILHSKYKTRGGKMWYLHASPHIGIYFPVYGLLDNIYSDFENDDGQDRNSIWWKFRLLQINVDANHDSLYMDFNKLRSRIQNEILLDNLKFELSNIENLPDWGVHQEKLSRMAMNLLSEF